MPKTYNDLYLATRTALKNAGVEAYALEARLLVAYAVGKTKEEFVRDLRLYTSDENEQKIEALLQRRIAGEPLAYLIGEWEFHGLPIVVTPDVLIPRMDTEVLVDAALRVLVGRKMNARILDLCSGSGCIGCALAHELPAATTRTAPSASRLTRSKSPPWASARSTSSCRTRRMWRAWTSSRSTAPCATTSRSARSTAARTG